MPCARNVIKLHLFFFLQSLQLKNSRKWFVIVCCLTMRWLFVSRKTRYRRVQAAVPGQKNCKLYLCLILCVCLSVSVYLSFCSRTSEEIGLKQNIRKFCRKDNCLASRDSPSDAEKLSLVMEFSVHTNSHYGFFFLHTFPSTNASKLKYGLFYQFYTKISIFWPRDVCLALIYYINIERFDSK